MDLGQNTPCKTRTRWIKDGEDLALERWVVQEILTESFSVDRWFAVFNHGEYPDEKWTRNDWAV
jgi:hypothetical protein